MLSEAVGAFDFGAGYFRWDDPKDEPMMVDSIRGGLHWDGAARRIVIDPVKLVSGDTKGAVAGCVMPREEGARLARPARALAHLRREAETEEEGAAC